MSALRTNGDGCCAMHAFLGSPELSSIGSVELWKADARIVAISHCGPSLEMLQARSGISSALRSIQTSLWKEFVEGHLQGHITNESTNFWNALYGRNPETAQEALTLFQNNASSTALYDRVKTEVVQAARFFSIGIWKVSSFGHWHASWVTSHQISISCLSMPVM